MSIKPIRRIAEDHQRRKRDSLNPRKRSIIGRKTSHILRLPNNQAVECLKRKYAQCA